MILRNWVIVGMCLTFLIGLVFAQPTANPINLPTTFTMQLNPLPPQQSPNQILFNCPYGLLEHRQTVVTGINQTLTETRIKATIKFWMNERKSACAITKEYNISLLATGTQAVNQFIVSVNNDFQAEALSNRQRSIERTPISIGGSG